MSFVDVNGQWASRSSEVCAGFYIDRRSGWAFVSITIPQGLCAALGCRIGDRLFGRRGEGPDLGLIRFTKDQKGRKLSRYGRRPGRLAMQLPAWLGLPDEMHQMEVCGSRVINGGGEKILEVRLPEWAGSAKKSEEGEG